MHFLHLFLQVQPIQGNFISFQEHSMKQKIVIKVQVDCGKCRAKAMEIASAEGVDSVALQGSDKDQIVIVGEDVDCVCLAKKLRKKLGHAMIISVEDVHEKEKKEKEEKEKKAKEEKERKEKEKKKKQKQKEKEEKEKKEKKEKACCEKTKECFYSPCCSNCQPPFRQQAPVVMYPVVDDPYGNSCSIM